MAKIVKNNLGNFLVVLVIFALVTSWIFSGWPQIWQEPPVPPEFEKVFAASPATLGATGNEAVLNGGWTDASNAHGTTDDNTYATAARVKDDPNISSNYLSYNFDAEIPVGASITKVEILPEWKVNSCAQPAVLTVLAVVSGASQASHDLICQDTESTSVVDITGDRTWTRDNLLDANFKVQAIANASGIGGKPGTTYTWSLDRIPVRVTYSTITISITRSAGDGTFAYGTVNLGTTTSTEPAGLNDVETFKNTGNGAEQFKIKTSHAVNGTQWDVTSGAPGTNTFRHSFTTTTSPTWQILDTYDTYETASSSVAVNGTVDTYMQIEMPTGTGGDYTAKTITISVMATTP